MQVPFCNLSSIIPEHKKGSAITHFETSFANPTWTRRGRQLVTRHTPTCPAGTFHKDLCDSACPTATRAVHIIRKLFYAYSEEVLRVPDWPSSTNLWNPDTCETEGGQQSREEVNPENPSSKQCAESLTRNFPNTKQKWQTTQSWRLVGPCSQNGRRRVTKNGINL